MRRSAITHDLAGTQRILTIDDDAALSECVQCLLRIDGYRPVTAGTAEAGLRLVAESDFDLIITDLRLPDSTGLDIIRTVKQTDPDVPIILMTSYSSMESAIEALRLGAVDYIIKPFDNEDFLHAVRRALNERRMQRENRLLKRSLKTLYGGREIIGQSEAIKRVLDLIRRVAPSDAPVLIQGESGTGKELVARALHDASTRPDGPFVPLNCGAIPADLLESELFGHVKGAYTGATSATEGLIREANGGTLLLDEISEMALNLQVKLLRVIQERQVRPLGANQTYQVDVRFLAASNKDLREEVRKGNFREDLYYRLNVITIQIPPLRDRGKDVELLAQHFIDYYSRKLGKRVRGMDQELLDFLHSYHWPGNVRELENLIQRAVIMCESEILTRADLADVTPAAARSPAPVDPFDKPVSVEDYIRGVVERYQGSYGEIELANLLGIGRKALWVRRRRWGLFRKGTPPTRKGAAQNLYKDEQN